MIDSEAQEKLLGTVVTLKCPLKRLPGGTGGTVMRAAMQAAGGGGGGGARLFMWSTGTAALKG